MHISIGGGVLKRWHSISKMKVRQSRFKFVFIQSVHGLPLKTGQEQFWWLENGQGAFLVAGKRTGRIFDGGKKSRALRPFENGKGKHYYCTLFERS